MKFDKTEPANRLKPYIKYFVITESTDEKIYKVFPSTSLVIGFQYQGHLALIKDGKNNTLATAGITGISDSYKVFKSTANIGTILVFFSETGITYFSNHPANELFNLSIALDTIFDKNKIHEAEDQLSLAQTDKDRIKIVERFFISALKDRASDKLIVEAVRRIYQSNGTIRIKELSEQLFISQSPFEKRFRKLVGTSPKKFASIVRFNAVLNTLDSQKSLTEICYENNFFDQAHFIKDFKQYTGVSPERFKPTL
ncbi:helix-turn-helix domain-containing protein [Chitinophaga sp. 30R24]|uniref:helix-turn-helix domain-containing protein n=1 Tax=Chitinophaga sp. 30R24 TaxID=3248838 RepID=UPI003B91D178